MIYSHKNDDTERNLTPAEQAKLKRLCRAASTAWMVDGDCRRR
ncbi:MULTISPECIES: hypothetical protein [Sulfurimonas]|uniref:Uncharacterized protein n=1 Tax=Sulfurimonas diazotrophicus TaxID=3131939 RepID=A0ABZ3HAD7_9BACT